MDSILTEREHRFITADFLAHLDTMAETAPEVAAHTAAYIRDEVTNGRWSLSRRRHPAERPLAELQAD